MLFAASVPAQAVDPQVRACGPKSDQSWICSVVFRVTDNRDAAEFADRFAVPLRIVAILLVAYVVVRIARLVIRRFVRRLHDERTQDRLNALKQRTGLALLDTSPTPSLRRAQRAETISIVLRSTASVLIWATALITILHELGVELAPLIAGAGVVGVALGFGAQSIVRDFLSGVFMLIEDQYGVGDVIDAGPAVGTVEGVSLRTTRLRSVDGTVWHIPNGEIHRVGNQSQQWSRALLDIPVPYDTDVAQATSVIKSVADDLWHDPDWQTRIISEPEVWGVEGIEADRLLIRLVAKTQPLEQWNVARELRARVHVALHEAGIEVPKS